MRKTTCSTDLPLALILNNRFGSASSGDLETNQMSVLKPKKVNRNQPRKARLDFRVWPKLAVQHIQKQLPKEPLLINI